MTINAPASEKSTADFQQELGQGLGLGLVLLPEDFVPSTLHVIIGRGKKHSKHSGNLRYDELVREEMHAYAGAENKVTKSQVINRLVERVRATGNFVREVPARVIKKESSSCSDDEAPCKATSSSNTRPSSAQRQRWALVEEHAVRTTTAQHFRDALHSKYRSSKAMKKRMRKAYRTSTGATTDDAMTYSSTTTRSSSSSNNGSSGSSRSRSNSNSTTTDMNQDVARMRANVEIAERQLAELNQTLSSRCVSPDRNGGGSGGIEHCLGVEDRLYKFSRGMMPRIVSNPTDCLQNQDQVHNSTFTVNNSNNASTSTDDAAISAMPKLHARVSIPALPPLFGMDHDYDQAAFNCDSISANEHEIMSVFGNINATKDDSALRCNNGSMLRYHRLDMSAFEPTPIREQYQYQQQHNAATRELHLLEAYQLERDVQYRHQQLQQQQQPQPQNFDSFTF